MSKSKAASVQLEHSDVWVDALALQVPLDVMHNNDG